MSTILDRPSQGALFAEFLRVASDLHRSLYEIHDSGAGAAGAIQLEPRFTEASTKLHGFLQRVNELLVDDDIVVVERDAVAIAVASRKVAQDLLVHLDRVIVSQSSSTTSTTDNSDIRARWPSVDVDALGQRLQSLGRQWSAVFGTPDSTGPLEELLRKVGISPSAGQEREVAATAEPETTQKKAGNVQLLFLKKPAAKKQTPTPASNETLEDFILDGLAYSSMRDREEEVTAAHDKTFDWVFQDKDDGSTQETFGKHFTNWMSTNDLGPLYWITGKPGSGKSTLMRFLFEHRSTMKRLKSWAEKRPVSLAGFFFWTSGSHEQRSQTGLLRYLLYQLLSDHRVLIGVTFPDLWERLLAMSTKDRIKLVLSWTATELMAAFHAFMKAALQTTQICLFIDGLDEFDGDHVMIIDFFKGLVEGENAKRVKLCLSSRPWAVFEAAFEHSVPHLKLQDLTYNDMYQYTSDRLRQDTRLGSLLRSDVMRGETLINNLVQKADGVFLWVRLAVNHILEHFKPGTDIEATLRRLPADLDQLFEQLLFQEKSSTQIAETGSLFQLIRGREEVSEFIKDESAHSLTVGELAFALRTEDNELALNSTVQRVPDDQAKNRIIATREHIHRAFSGLLDIHAKRRSGNARNFQTADGQADTALASAMEGRVTYIHRTIRDWLLETGEVEKRLIGSSPQDFDPHLRLLRSYILRLKMPIEEPERHRRLDDWWPDIALALTHARYATNDSEHLLRAFVNELNNTLSWYWLPRSRDPSDHWARSAFGAYEVRMKAPPIEEPFLCLATKFGLTQYIREELKARKVPESDSDEDSPKPTPPLAYAVEFLCSRNLTIYPLSDPELVKELLTTESLPGQGPNSLYSDFITHRPRTPWIALLRHLRDARRRGWIEYYDADPTGIGRWSKTVELFLRHGADQEAVVVADNWDPEITARGVFEMLDETYGAVELREILGLMDRSRDSGTQ